MWRVNPPGEKFDAGDFIFLIGEVGDAGHPICLTREVWVMLAILYASEEREL